MQNSQYLCGVAVKPEGGCWWGVGGLLEKSNYHNFIAVKEIGVKSSNR